LNNSNDPIHANYKKNGQYWKGVAAVYNNNTPKIGEGCQSKSRITSGESRKELHGSLVLGRRQMLCGLVVNLM
jgi:hypothetical protein